MCPPIHLYRTLKLKSQHSIYFNFQKSLLSYLSEFNSIFKTLPFSLLLISKHLLNFFLLIISFSCNVLITVLNLSSFFSILILSFTSDPREVCMVEKLGKGRKSKQETVSFEQSLGHKRYQFLVGNFINSREPHGFAQC